MFNKALTPRESSLFLRPRTSRFLQSEVAGTGCTDSPSGLLRVMINIYFPHPCILFRWPNTKLWLVNYSAYWALKDETVYM